MELSGAILIGMTMGPVLAGNTIVVKPASNTPIIRSALDGDGGGGGDSARCHQLCSQFQVVSLATISSITRWRSSSTSRVPKDVGLRIAERSAKSR